MPVLKVDNGLADRVSFKRVGRTCLAGQWELIQLPVPRYMYLLRPALQMYEKIECERCKQCGGKSSQQVPNGKTISFRFLLVIPSWPVRGMCKQKWYPRLTQGWVVWPSLYEEGIGKVMLTMLSHVFGHLTACVPCVCTMTDSSILLTPTGAPLALYKE